MSNKKMRIAVIPRGPIIADLASCHFDFLIRMVGRGQFWLQQLTILMRNEEMSPRQQTNRSSTDLKKSITAFIRSAVLAEKEIRESYGRGRIPPDYVGDNWDADFEQAYKSISFHIPQSATQFYVPPAGTAYCSHLFEASNPVEAWMFLINPADEAFGEVGFLDSPEYLEI
ncbi:MAG: hypothetical protein KDA78_20315, partial [Planctomycetaceae bacterium]|nr:hypothetical protein [Planctomycetaceae bacterium]